MFLSGCEQDRCVRTEEYTAYEPVYKRIDEMRVPVAVESPRALNAPGKIYYYNGYLLINELNQGIHVIDNHDPANPVNLSFLNIPGNIDMAIHGTILYADSYLDLVAIDLVNIQAPAEVDRVNDVFQSFYSWTDQLGYLVEYKPTPVKRTIDCSDSNWGRGWWFEGDVLLSSDASFGGVKGENVSSVTPSVIIGGSMARFTVADDHLYTIDGSEVKVFNVSQVHPELKNEVVMQWGIETLFPMAGSLFVGSNNGLLIYDITNPSSPEFRANFTHASSCDPVFVSGNTAFVTLRSGNACQGFTNQLEVIDVTDLYNPELLHVYPMDNPHGLSVVDNTLYLCEGEFGFKTYDVADLAKIDTHLLDRLQGFTSYDVIVLPPGDLVMIVGKDGLYQFDAADRSDLKQLSVLEIGK